MNTGPSHSDNGLPRRNFLQLAGAGAVASAAMATGVPVEQAAAQPSSSAAGAQQSLITSFIGVGQAFVPDTYPLGRQLGASWGRLGADWYRLQPDPNNPVDLNLPAQGRTPFREVMRQLTEAGYQPLVGLGSAPEWAVDKSYRSFVERGVQFEFRQDADGRMIRTVTDPDTGEVLDQTAMTSLGRFPPADVARYEEYVEAVVSELTRDFGVQYFVLTNEPVPLHGSSSQEWVDKVIKPASAIIRAHGGKTVWGALPAGGRYEEFNKLLNYNDAWRDIDVLDVHYWPPQGWQWMWEDWVRPGKIEALWQSEVGAGISRLQVPNYYPRFLHWALTHGWSEQNPDKYKLFYFKLPWEGRGPDGYYAAGLTYTNADTGELALTYHGTAMKTLHDLLDGPDLRAYDGVRFTGLDIGGQDGGQPASPDLKEESIEAFQVGSDRIVIAAHLAATGAVIYVDHRNRELINLSRREYKQDRFVEIQIPGLAIGSVESAEAIDSDGNRSAPAIIEGSGRNTVVRVDPRTVIAPGRSFELARESPYTFYIDIRIR